MRSECGARGRSRKPLPGGSGPLLGRHDDRSPRSAVDSRQIEAGNARQVGSQETQELELSQRRMRSPWRVPRRSAERRAARDRAAAAQQMSCAVMAGAPIGAPPPFRGGRLFRTRGGWQSSDAKTHSENDFVCRAGQGREGKVERSSCRSFPRKRESSLGPRLRGDER
jgi:hypothetical protein